MGKQWEATKASFWAWWRQGHKEIAQVLPAFPTSVRPIEELGGIGNPTQMEVSNDKGVYKNEMPSEAQEQAYAAKLADRADSMQVSQERESGLER